MEKKTKIPCRIADPSRWTFQGLVTHRLSRAAKERSVEGAGFMSLEDDNDSESTIPMYGQDGSPENPTTFPLDMSNDDPNPLLIKHRKKKKHKEKVYLPVTYKVPDARKRSVTLPKSGATKNGRRRRKRRSG